ncbi:MAG TPA: SURF1 family protein [Steroidobacteraceae bacterium]|nr:SURF1 family protein [Steroidobacteraceae bacterium]
MSDIAMTMKVFGREFAPSWLMTIATLSFGCLFVTLGFWQWGRGVERQATWDAFQNDAANVIDADAADLASLPRYAHVRLRGSYAPTRQFLLDNRTFEGRAGYEVLTPFELTSGGTVLINRGWIHFGGFRDRLPDVSFDAPPQETILGRIEELPAAGLAAGRVAPATEGVWPRVTSFPTAAELTAAYAQPLLARVVLLDVDAPRGFERHWSAPGLEPIRHFSYAVQWWAFAVLLAGLYIGLNLRQQK